ncbi:MAG: sugar phosphate isomerase/epimerase family protein [Phycisphaerales bacterium JB063]
MIKGISYWSLKGGADGSADIAHALSDAKQAGFEALELAIGTQGHLTIDATEEQCSDIRAYCDESGLVVETLASGMSWKVNPVSDDPGERALAIAQNRQAIERAAWLGCTSYLLVPGVACTPWNINQAVRYDLALERATRLVGELLETAEQLEVEVCIENVWNGMFYSPIEFADFLDQFASPYCGAYFDVGNVVGYHQYPPHWIELLGDRIKRVHIKGFRFDSANSAWKFCRLLEGDIPWRQVMTSLRRIGYDGTVIAEMMPYADDLLTQTSQAMDEIFQR